MNQNLVGRAEYKSDKEGIDRRFQASADVHAEIKADNASTRAEALTGIKDLTKRMDESDRADQKRRDDIEKEQRQNRTTRTFAVIMAVATPILGIVAGILFRGGA